MKKIALFSIILLFLIGKIDAQTVETIATHPKILDGLYVDDMGNVFTTSGGLQGGVDIGKYDMVTNDFDDSFASGFFGPIDIIEDQNGHFIVTNYDNNTVSRLNLDTNQVTTIATGLDGPSGMVLDSNNNVYVANYGAPPTYNGHQIHKITPSGDVSVFVDSPELTVLQPMTINADGDLIIESQANLYKIDLLTGVHQLWVENVGMNIGHMKFRSEDSCIYATAPQAHKILKITEDGTVSVYAGSFAGHQDGPLDEAKFRNPLGIEFSPDESAIYISEAGYSTGLGNLRKINMEILEVEEEGMTKIEVYPNPVKDLLNVTSTGEIVNLKIYTILGNLIMESKCTTINVSGLTKGLYLVALYSDGQKSIKKFVKD